MKRLVITSCVALCVGFVVIMHFFSRPAGAESRLAIKRIVRFVPGRVLVKFRPEIMPDHARQIIAAMGVRDAEEIGGIGVHLVELPPQASEQALVHAFMSRQEVEFAELDQLLPPEQVTPNDPLYNDLNSWSLPRIDAPGAWLMNTGSSNVTIAILDTGVDWSHPDLVGQLGPGWNVYNNTSDTSDVYGHGTAVAGSAGAASNNGIGVTAVAWTCRIMPIRIAAENGMAPVSAIANGLSWAAAHGARVANISYYITGSRTVSTAARSFKDQGGVVVAAAGNYGVTETIADDPSVIHVGGTDPFDNLYSWSNRGSNLDLVAPGGVYTTSNGGGYGVGGGTSFASPVVAGVAALVLSSNPSLTPAQVETILKQNADDLGTAGWDPLFGYGRVNAATAVIAALGGGGGGTSDTNPPTIDITSPSSGSVVSGAVIVQVTATDDVGVFKAQLFVDGALVATSTTSPFNLKWNSRKAKAGQHLFHAKAFDAAGNVGTSSTVTVYK